MVKKLSNFIVDKRIPILIIMLILAAVCAFGSTFVKVNSDMTKYLPDDSQMKTGVDIMNKEFPEMETSKTIRVMFDDLTGDQINDVKTKLEAIENVGSVDYDPESSDFNKDNHTLFVINMDCEYQSAEQDAIEKSLKDDFSDYKVVWHDDFDGNMGIPPIVLVAVMAILITILLFMCGSWFEPVLFLFTIGIAVFINLGTNIFRGEVADVTQSIAAILQMGLSMDYSIILMNRYRQERANEPDKVVAMKKALKNAFSSVASSSMTTVVGLLMLVFMSFKIGEDLGIVLAKGVFCSMVCVLTMLPGLTLLFDKVITKTSKKQLHIPMNWAAKFSFKARIVMPILFVILFGVVIFLQQRTGIAYTLVKDDLVADVFPKDNMIVLLYDNNDEEAVTKLSEDLSSDEKVKSVMGYGSIFGKQYTVEEMADVFAGMGGDVNMDPTVLKMFYYDYANNGETGTMKVGEFMTFVSEDVMTNETFSDRIDEGMKEQASMMSVFSSKEALTTPMTSEELAEVFGMESKDIDSLFMLYNMSDKENQKDKLSVEEFINFINDTVLTNPMYSSGIDEEQGAMLSSATSLVNAVISDEEYTSQEMADLFSGFSEDLDSGMIDLMYLFAKGTNSEDLGTMDIDTMFNYLVEKVNDPTFGTLLSEEDRQTILDSQSELDDGKAQLKGANNSRVILTTSYPDEGEEVNKFIENIQAYAKDNFKGQYYLIGNSVMNHEMESAFGGELLFITLITALAIFLIVAITFRSLIIPVILVCMVQCSVYITVIVTGILGGNIYYLSLLIVECILMGATIDYGILFTNYYRESRRIFSVQDALKKAYEGSIHTIMTSGMILVLVTAAVGNLFEDAAVTAIVNTISIGSLCAIILILFVLPGILAVVDKLIIRKNK